MCPACLVGAVPQIPLGAADASECPSARQCGQSARLYHAVHLMHMWGRFLLLALLCVLSGCAALKARPVAFVGAVAGISTLSADAQANVTGAAADVSLYKPENGPALNLLAGAHLNDYLSVQANYVWNQNMLTLTSTSVDGTTSFFEERRESTQHAVVGDVLLYFRDRDSWARPYLSAGIGLMHLQIGEPTLLALRGQPSRPPATFAATEPVLRVAVGIDLRIRRGWRFRYSFSETISRNGVSAQLAPPAQRSLANFQNLFGVTKSF
jgi:hypothetical protein